jgi:quercetin dioxygenase-like cupin family protein
MQHSTRLALFAAPCLALGFAGGVAVSRAASPPAALLGSTTASWDQIEAATGKGMSKPIFRSPTVTLDELEMHVTHVPPGKAPHTPHTHPEEELVILKEGTLEVLQAGKTSRLGAGGVIFQASNQLHGVRNVGDVTATYYVLRWKAAGKPQSPATAPVPAAAPKP